MAKRMLQILDEINLNDCEKGTSNLRISNTLISADKVKQGGKISMGVDESCLMDLINDKSVAILLVIDRKEYENQQNTAKNI